MKYELRSKGQPEPVTLEFWHDGRQVGVVALHAEGSDDPRPGDHLTLLVSAAKA